MVLDKIQVSRLPLQVQGLLYVHKKHVIFRAECYIRLVLKLVGT
jgi:hypothetical protein